MELEQLYVLFYNNKDVFLSRVLYFESREFEMPSDRILSFTRQLDNLPAGFPPRTIRVGPSCWSTRGSGQFLSHITFARS